MDTGLFADSGVSVTRGTMAEFDPVSPFPAIYDLLRSGRCWAKDRPRSIPRPRYGASPITWANLPGLVRASRASRIPRTE